jgi:hypothetical protein
MFQELPEEEVTQVTRVSDVLRVCPLTEKIAHP